MLIRNEMGQKFVLTEELFLEVLCFAEKHGWKPMGTSELYSTHPSLYDYRPGGVNGYRTIWEKDAIAIHFALKIALASGVKVFGNMNRLEDEHEEEGAAAKDLTLDLVKFFKRGWVVVSRWSS